MPTENVVDIFNLEYYKTVENLYDFIENKCILKTDILNKTNNQTKSDFIYFILSNLNPYSIYDDYKKKYLQHS